MRLATIWDWALLFIIPTVTLIVFLLLVRCGVL